MDKKEQGKKMGEKTKNRKGDEEREAGKGPGEAGRNGGQLPQSRETKTSNFMKAVTDIHEMLGCHKSQILTLSHWVHWNLLRVDVKCFNSL